MSKTPQTVQVSKVYRGNNLQRNFNSKEGFTEKIHTESTLTCHSHL